MLEKKAKEIKIGFIILLFIFTIPSIYYIIKNKSVVGFNNFYNFILTDANTILQAIIFIIVFSLIVIAYFLVIKYRKKIFTNIKDVFIYILFASCISLIILPFTSSDVYYYMGIGRLDSHYNQNPYEVSMKQYMRRTSRRNLTR